MLIVEKQIAALKKRRKKFSVILIDPPWHFATWSIKGQGRAPPYETLSLAQIKALDLPSLMEKDCALFLWIINPLDVRGVQNAILRSWGVKPSSVAFTWVKLNLSGPGWHRGTGYGTRQNTERCFLGRKGAPKRLHADVPELMISRVREHSRKPDLQYKRIERLFGGARLEVFARKRRAGWTAVGDQVGLYR